MSRNGSVGSISPELDDFCARSPSRQHAWIALGFGLSVLPTPSTGKADYYWRDSRPGAMRLTGEREPEFQPYAAMTQWLMDTA